MLLNSLNKTHTSTQGLQEVHDRMLDKFVKNDSINADIATAKKLQTYLQYFKKIFNHPENYETNDPLLKALNLDKEAIILMRTRFQEVLSVTSKYNQIFRSQHSWYADRKDFDDIVEGEINALLQVIAEKATGNIPNINLGQKIVGNTSALVNLPSDIGKELVHELVNNMKNKLSIKKATRLINEIKANSRTGKTDVVGYNEELVVNAKISPQFEEFIRLFTSVRLSIKNYKGNTSYQIHLGKSLPFKAMYGALIDLGYDNKSAIHIYCHARSSYQKHQHTTARNNDIFHLRYAYELTGSGLSSILDGAGQNFLDSADYLVYNDPTSDNIFVKSTKQMINEILTNKNLNITNPWLGIYVSKLSFS